LEQILKKENVTHFKKYDFVPLPFANHRVPS
jgi:hypothetical protein